MVAATNETTAPPQIHARMIAILRETEAIGKNRKNQQQGFAFRGIDDCYNELHPLFARHGVFIRPEVLDRETCERTTAKGGAIFYHVARVRFDFVADDGSSVSCTAYGEAADTGDKGLGKAVSYALKQTLFQMLLVPTEGDNDPDSTAHEIAPKPAAAQPPAPKAEPPKYATKVGELKAYLHKSLGVTTKEDADLVIRHVTNGTIGTLAVVTAAADAETAASALLETLKLLGKTTGPAELLAAARGENGAL